MAFIFWAGLAFLLGCAFCVHFDVFGFRRRLTKNFLYAFSFILPKIDSRGRRMKFGMAKTASYVFAVVLFLLLTSIFLSFAVPYAIGEEENKFTGPLGDLFNGILTPVLTFLTFCGLLVTIIIQNVQMKATLQELELTRKEMSESTDALQAQVANSTAQKFDSNFYEMLKLHTTISEQLKNRSEVIEYEFDSFNKKSSLWSGFNSPNVLRSFFLINYQLLKYIKSNEDSDVITSKEAKKYANIARAMLPDDLFGLIFLNCLNPRFSKYKELIEHYQFLEHLVFSGFEDAYTVKAISEYSRKAFGDSENMRKFLEDKKEKILEFVGKDVISYMKSTDRRIKSDREIIDKYEIKKLKRSDPEKYANMVEKLDLFNNFIVDIKNIIVNLSLVECLDDENLVNVIASKDQFYFLRKFHFNFENYIQVIKYIFDLKGNWYGLFNGAPSHIKNVETGMRAT